MSSTPSPTRRRWSPSTWFIALGVAANAALTLIDLLRGRPVLWDAVPLLLGSGPNLVAVPAIAFTGLGLALHPEYRTRFARLTDAQLATGVVLGSVIGLMGWEVAQRGSARLRFDVVDLGATVLGGLLCAVVATRLLKTTPVPADLAEPASSP